MDQGITTIGGVSASGTVIEQATTSVPTGINVYGPDLLTPLLKGIFGNGLTGMFAGGGLIGLLLAGLAFIWNIFVFLAFVLALLFLFLYIYATTKKKIIVDLMTEELRQREATFARTGTAHTSSAQFMAMQERAGSDNPSDWKLAIIEADILLEETLRERGFPGNSIGERLRNITPANLSSVDDAWEAHKVRNQIAHAGADFVLTQKLANETMMRYERVFIELGII